jgi:hypothetical protein
LPALDAAISRISAPLRQAAALAINIRVNNIGINI